jgi:HlyD family secretion protein
MKRIFILLLVLIFAGFGFYYYQSKQRPINTQELSLYGNVDIRQVRTAFQVSGQLVAMHADEGDHVKSGALLAELDAARYEARVQKSQADFEAQQQIVAALVAGSRPQEIKKAEAEVRALTVQTAELQKTMNRLKKLIQTRATSRQKLDDAISAYNASQERLEAARQALDLILAGPRKEDIAAARAKLAAARANVTLAEKDLKDSKLLAPSDGEIQNRLKEPGDMVFPSTPVFTIAQTEPLWIRTYIPETDLGKISAGMKASVYTDSFPGKSYKAWIGFISPTAEFTPKNVETPSLRTRLVYQARIIVCNPDNELRLGMPATVRIDLTQADQSDVKSGCSDNSTKNK